MLEMAGIYVVSGPTNPYVHCWFFLVASMLHQQIQNKHIHQELLFESEKLKYEYVDMLEYKRRLELILFVSSSTTVMTCSDILFYNHRIAVINSQKSCFM